VDYQGVVLTGTSGAGKTSVARKLIEISEKFTRVQALTTRKQREDDEAGEYLYLSEEEFTKLDREGDLLIKSTYRGDNYGIAKKTFHELVNNGRVPVMVVTPESVQKLEETQLNKPNMRLPFLTIFLDAHDDTLDNRLKERGQKIIERIKAQRLDDREYEKSCIYSVLNTDLAKTVALIDNLWQFRNNEGILPKSLIKLMIECGMLLENAQLENISGASYDLIVADDHYYGGKPVSLTEQDPFIKIEPFEFAFVRSKETCNLPRDVAGRFDVAVSLFLGGLIMSNGPQVDPGFRGGLWCLLFNTSNDTVELKRGQHYATIEFTKLVHPTHPYKGKYQDKEKIADYLPHSASRSPISELKKDIRDLKSEKWWVKILPLILASAAIVVAIVVAIVFALK
jgi:deoxycytidine triphosphate deaminase